MLEYRVIHMFIALGFISETLAAFGDLRISGGGKSGRLEFRRSSGSWVSVCRYGFDDDAGDVACRQLGYIQSTDVYTYDGYYYDSSNDICGVDCYGDEDELTDCYYTSCDSCVYEGGAVAISCTNSLTPGQIAGVIVGVLVFIGLITTCIIVCTCCLVPSCPCYYYRRSRFTHTTVVTQQTPQVITATSTTSSKTTNYPPPPAYNPGTGYQPYPATSAAATTAKY